MEFTEPGAVLAASSMAFHVLVRSSSPVTTTTPTPPPTTPTPTRPSTPLRVETTQLLTPPPSAARASTPDSSPAAEDAAGTVGGPTTPRQAAAASLPFLHVAPPSPVSPGRAMFAKRSRAMPRSLGMRALVSGRIGAMQTARAVGWLLASVSVVLATLAMYGHLLPALVLMARYYVAGDSQPVLAATGADLGLLVVGNIVASLVSYHLLCGFLYRHYYVDRASPEQRRLWKLHPESLPSRETVDEEIRLSQVSMTISTAASALKLAYLTCGGVSRLYFDASTHSLVYNIGSCCGAFLLQDLCFYVTHRLLHDVPFLMKHVHVVHHRFHHPTPYAVLAMHWVEGVLLESSIIIPLFVFPVWAPYFYGSLIYTLLSGIAGHSGVDLPALLPWQAPSWFHDHHHRFVTGNYGSSLLVWDYIFGTYRARDNEQESFVVDTLGAAAHSTDAQAGRSGAAAVYVPPSPLAAMVNLVRPARREIVALATAAYRRLAKRRE